MSLELSDTKTAAASWFPGHMAAGLRALVKASDLIDVLVEVRDARLPKTTAVAGMPRKLNTKPSLIFLNREDLADRAMTSAWIAALREEGRLAFSGIGTKAQSLRHLRKALLSQSARRFRLRVAVVGAPNTGKSSVINALSREKRALTRNKPGVTRHLQWLRFGDRVDILDTPGVLPSRQTDATAAWQLALCGILPEAAFDPLEVVERFALWCLQHRPEIAPAADLDSFAARRGKRQRGGELDRTAAARMLLSAFRAGTFGGVTFERPGE